MAVAVWLLALGPMPAAQGAGRYEPVLEWDGPQFRVLHEPGVDQWVDDPAHDFAFVQPRGIQARGHGGRDVVYVLDAGNHRIQIFEVNATNRSISSADFSFAGGAPAAGQFSAQTIRPAEWNATATQWIVPFSEAVQINGVDWSRVDDLTSYSAADHVYTVDYDAPTNSPEITFPAGALSALSLFEARYVLTDVQDIGASSPIFGVGDVDYGLHSGDLTWTPLTIDETSGGPAEWNEPRGLALSTDPTDATTDLLFVVDAADDSGSRDEQIFSYLVTEAGVVTAGERYDDELSRPQDACVAARDAGRGASAWVSANTGPFDRSAYPFVLDASQVTGHAYDVVVASGFVTITDQLTGRVLVQGALQAAFADPFLGIPGLSLPLNAGAWADGATVVHTTKAAPGRFLFVADTGADRIKIIGLASDATSAGSVWAGDWLPGEIFTGASQPGGAGTLGQTAGDDYWDLTPAAVPEDYVAWTAGAPLAEHTLLSLVMDPAGLARTWRQVADLSVAAPQDSVFQVDWQTGAIRFGDGIHGSLPPANTAFEYSYRTTPDLLRYGSTGTALGRFDSPRGISARWNSRLARFDLYVADTGNLRVQKLAFYPADTLLQLPARLEPVNAWTVASGPNDLLASPTDIAVAADSSGTVSVAVTDWGNHRVVLYRDGSAGLPGSVVSPAYAATLGSAGQRVGNYVAPAGLAFVTNGPNLDLYVSDDARNITTKYESGPTPTIDILTVGESALPQAFPPHSGYQITFETRFAPLGGWVDFYFDEHATFDDATARLCFPVGQISPTASAAFWRFANSPGGLPPDGDYYLYARLKDSTGSTVASDQTILLERITIDSRLVPTLQVRDAIDHDRTLYLQPSLRRDVDLEVLYPDSTIGAGFTCTYDPSLVRILGVVPGNAFDGVGYTNLLFHATVDSAGGTFSVQSSVTGAPVGLTRSGPHRVAIVHLQARGEAISVLDRFKDSQIAIDRTRSGLVRTDGAPPVVWATRSLAVRFAYLGDVATRGAGADSLLPHLQPRPDGHIDFDDQMVFTLGWNGVNQIQDRISDLGPAAAFAPKLLGAPDATWSIDDILAFTTQASYFGAAGWNNTGTPGLAAPPRPSLSTPELAAPLLARLLTRADGSVEVAVHGVSLRNLTGASLTLVAPPGSASVESVEPGDLLGAATEQLTVVSAGDGWRRLDATRLSPRAPGVTGSGALARFVVRPLAPDRATSPGAPAGWQLSFDLRDAENRSIGRGSLPISLENDDLSGAAPARFAVSAPSPNPATAEPTLHFDLPTAAAVRLAVYDVAGRCVRNMEAGTLAAGTHALVWDGRQDGGAELPAGLYWLRLEAGAERAVRRVVLAHSLTR